ncbi:MAG: ATP-binding protein [Planctomycetota bacterium]
MNLLRLPITGELLIGRDKEIHQLDEFWNNSKFNVITLQGWGGCGKSSLVNHWLATLAEDGWQGVEKVFGWSFSKQGFEDSTVAAADEFFSRAFQFFAIQSKSSELGGDRGEQLASTLQDSRVLLILDGLEPLQHRKGPQKGQIIDPELATLIRSLAAVNSGLCVIMSRETVAGIASFSKKTAQVVELNALDDSAGEELLRELGIRGSSTDIRNVSRTVKGHALTLNLVGNYLRDFFGGHVMDFDRALRIAPDDSEQTILANVMSSYDRQLGDGPELEVLRMLSVFDRPAKHAEIKVLLMDPPIPGVSTNLVALTEHHFRQVIVRLHRTNLMEKRYADTSEIIDLHPLVRAHYSSRLRKAYPDGWKQANNRLYDYLTQQSPEFPENIDQFVTLCKAVSHGCRAGKQREAFEELYRKRICPQTEESQDYFSRNALGGVAADLAALTDFFDVPWSDISPGFDQQSEAWILNAAGIDLWNLGRLKEALPLVSRPVGIATDLEDARLIARYAGDLSELYQFLGRFEHSRSNAEISVQHADECKVNFLRCYARVRLGDVRNQTGDFRGAESSFREAEQIQACMNPNAKRLHSVYGYWFCELLLQQVIEEVLANAGSIPIEKLEEIEDRAQMSMEWADTKGRVLDFGHGHLLLARTSRIRSQINQDNDLSKAQRHAKKALANLRRAGQQDEIPRGLIARAEIRRLSGNLHGAGTDLREALAIASRGSMKTHRADIYLGRALLQITYAANAIAAGKREEGERSLTRSRKEYDKARKLIENMRYHRRDSELAFVRQRIEAVGTEAEKGLNV